MSSTKTFSDFTIRLREFIRAHSFGVPPSGGLDEFNVLALELFALQFNHNAAYRRICEARDSSPKTVGHWTQIPAVPATAFKEFDLTCLPPGEREFVFHSSGTTEQKPSRHFHNAESLAIYETSLLSWFDARFRSADFSPLQLRNGKDLRTEFRAPLIILTPPPTQAPHSSLVHMFETVRREFDFAGSVFAGKTGDDGAWTLDLEATLAALEPNSRLETQNPKLILGTAFSFVHLLDYLAENNLFFELPAGSRAMETGGYKGRSRSLPKEELHALITERLGIPASQIICEYGMSELSSQAYDGSHHASRITHHAPRIFHFPPWARSQIISPETNHEVSDGETGLIRVFDLANVFSVMAIQTEDLGVRRGEGFELIGRAQHAEPRGCSLMTHSALRTLHSNEPA